MLHLGLQNLLFPFCPNLVNIIDRKAPIWDSIQNRFEKRIDFIDNEIAQKREKFFDTTLFDLLARIKQGDPIAESFLIYLDKTIGDLYAILKPMGKHFKSSLKLTLINLVANFDNSRCNYVDMVGEICLMHAVLTLPNLPYRLERIEYPLSNGKRIDYLLTNRHTGHSVLIDVLNIRIQSNRIVDSSSLEKFLLERVKNKKAKKLQNLPPLELSFPFAVAPVLWCDLEEMKNFESYFDQFPLTNDGVPCFSLGQSIGNNGRYNFEFATMQSLLKRVTYFVE